MVFFRSVLLCIFVLGLSAHGQLCPRWLLSWGQARDWNRSLYEIARAHAARGELPLKELDSPEKIFAYVDNLTPVRPFQSQIAAIEALGGRVKLKNYLVPKVLERQSGILNWDWVVRAPQSYLISEWRSFYRLPYRSREAVSIITVANAPPRSEQQLVDWATQYGAALAYHRLRLRAGYSGLAWGFTNDSLGELQAAESDQYSALAALLSAHPDTKLNLPKTDGVWVWRKIQTALGLPLRILFPAYSALSPYRTNLEGMRAWQEGSLASHLRKKYVARLRWKWLIDRYRPLFLASTLIALPTIVRETEETFFSGELWERLEQMRKDLEAIPERYSPFRVTQDVRKYHQTPGGDPTINEHYNEKIRAIEETIARSGDPDGKLRRKIEKLIETRELLNH